MSTRGSLPGCGGSAQGEGAGGGGGGAGQLARAPAQVLLRARGWQPEEGREKGKGFWSFFLGSIYKMFSKEYRIKHNICCLVDDKQSSAETLPE